MRNNPEEPLVCQKPRKTNLELILSFFRYWLRYLDRNKSEAILFYIAVIFLSMATVFFAMNKDISEEFVKFIVKFMTNL